MPFTFNSEEFKVAMEPFGYQRNKGLWSYFRQTRNWRKYHLLVDQKEKAVFLLNAYLNGAYINIDGACHRPTIVMRRPTLLAQAGTERTLEKYRRAIEAIDNLQK